MEKTPHFIPWVYKSVCYSVIPWLHLIFFSIPPPLGMVSCRKNSHSKMCISSSFNMEKQAQWRRERSSPCQLSAWKQAMERHPGRISLEDDFIRPDREFMAAAPAGAGSLSCFPVCSSLRGSSGTPLGSKDEPQQLQTSEFANHLSHLIHIWPYDYCHLKNKEYGLLQMGKQTQTSKSYS